jgi:hypothetical protein
MGTVSTASLCHCSLLWIGVDSDKVIIKSVTHTKILTVATTTQKVFDWIQLPFRSTLIVKEFIMISPFSGSRSGNAKNDNTEDESGDIEDSTRIDNMFLMCLL